VTCRTTLFRPKVEPIPTGLPSLPQVAYVGKAGRAPHPAIAKLFELMRTAALEL
ncbi:MAG TPA: LysR family transcriptional regulator, partial [Pseudomonas sp.]|nr:LysR family transcriptional regulator [Pseudomonas sp.]